MTFVGGQVLSINFVRYLFLKIHVEVCVSIHKKNYITNYYTQTSGL